MKKTATKPNPKKAKAPAKPRELNIRQQRFCEFVASGESDVQAYIKAGYTKSLVNAERNAWRVKDNEGVKARIAKLRAQQTKKAMLTKERKRALLMAIAEDHRAGYDARIRAMAEDSKMSGHYEPDRVEIEAGPNTLQSIKERADVIREDLRRKYGTI